ncbi:MAG: BMP family ABC transporter substrate-binding protein [Eubacteriales bacterium]|nr:BMP family ABC transporter substrate-binding protein [Eubacteriales bacterium]
MQNSKSDNNIKAGTKLARWGTFFLLSLMMFSILIMAACDSDQEPGQPVTETTTKVELPPGQLEPGERDQVAFILLDSIKSTSGENAYKGLQLIAATNAECRYVENVPVSAAEDIAERLIRAEYNIIFFDSAAFSEVALSIAKANPDIMFFVIEGTTTNNNLVNISFRTEEQSFLLGAAASVISPDNSIGFIAAYPDNTESFLAEAFEAGAKYVNPTIEVHISDLDPEQKDASSQTEQLISRYDPSVLAVMAGDASESAMYAAREAGLKIVAAQAGVKLLIPVTEPSAPEETNPEQEEETSATSSPEPTATGTVPSWSPGATRSTAQANDPNLYDPASLKVLLKRAEAYLYAYELFRNQDLPADTIHCGVREELITVEDYAEDISSEQIASIENVMDIIAQGDVSIPR